MNTSAYELIEGINDTVRRYIEQNMTETNAEALGLDPRAAYRLYVDDCTIAVDKYMDKTLQYYGGFEYIDKEFRNEMGDYVFYHADENEDNGYGCRVSSCLEKFAREEEKETSE